MFSDGKTGTAVRVGTIAAWIDNYFIQSFIIIISIYDSEKGVV